ncbi:hybrid sensor histidine kinase/response regulator [Teichococcus aestuarii]|uniref:histidine kinase n=2 Tax=Teichococcus aestuarii TaxID=568898 RepID=A0A2U1V7H9_9PROT|nr:PAS domain-containing sensor histidine kinase [Pseudoroseomonas aestuarii]PWC29869.1 hybrid sensor histidine kinase/response regulator [Pseudoroseomonas aestuarii]
MENTALPFTTDPATGPLAASLGDRIGPWMAAFEAAGVALAVLDGAKPELPLLGCTAAFTARGGPGALERLRQAGPAAAREAQGRAFRAADTPPLFLAPGPSEGLLLCTLPEGEGQEDRRLRAQLALSGSAAWEWEIATGRIAGDTQFAAWHGLPLAGAALDPSGFFACIHPQDRMRIRLGVGGLLRGAELFSKEYRLLGPDGTVRWVQARTRCWPDAQGQPARLIGTLTDITEQKRTEERLRIAQSAGGIGTFEHVPGFGTAAVSGTFCALLGLRPVANLPVPLVNSLVAEGDPSPFDRAPPAAPGPAETRAFRIRRADDGTPRWLMRRGEYLRDADTSELRFSGVLYDVTATQEAEARLRTLNEALESRVAERTRELDRVWRVSRDLFFVGDAEGRCVSANPAWQAALGLPAAGLPGTPLGALVQEEDRDMLEAALAQLRHGGADVAVELRMRHADGTSRAFSWACIPDEAGFVAAGRDVTRRNELEERLRQSQKMEAVGQLTGGLAHDFNNLLAGIGGSLELMQLRLAGGQVAALPRHVELAQGAVQRAAALTHRLLAFARRQTLDAQPTAVNVLVEGMLELVQRSIGPHIRIETRFEPALWLTLCDQNQLENALLNLCLNARDAMAGGGLLRITTANTALGVAAAQALDLPPADYVRLTVADTGSGMDAATLAKVFEPFFTTKPLGGGTGLGLSMVYGFARQSGGQVRIDSVPGEGTAVHLYLPRHGEAAPQAPPAAAAGLPPARPGRRGTLLLVDDEPSLRAVLREALDYAGYTVLEAEDGAGGLALLRSAGPVDLLLADVGLPGGMNGRQLADAARQEQPGLKVLLITGYADAATLGADRAEAQMEILAKPFRLAEFLRRVERLLP